DHADGVRAVAQRYGEEGLFDVGRARDAMRELAVRRVADAQRLAGLGAPAGDAEPDPSAQQLERQRKRLRRELAAERDRDELLALDDEHATVVVIDQRAQLRRDLVADLAYVVQA